MSQTIELKPREDKDHYKFELLLHGFIAGQSVTLEIWETDRGEDYAKHGDTKIGTITGLVVQPNKAKPRQFLASNATTGTVSTGDRVLFVTDQHAAEKTHAFSPITVGEADEGDSWEIDIRVAGTPGVKSSRWFVPRISRSIGTSKATYQWHSRNDVTFYNDASTDQKGSAGAFHDIEQAIGEATHFIFIADWSFHPYMQLTRTSTKPVGQTLVDWAKADSNRIVAIHTWDHTSPATDDQNDSGESIFKALKKPKNMLWRMSSRTGEDGGAGFGWSHHQKFVVLDAPCSWDNKRRIIRVFLGGLDLTQGRFDWPEHPFLPNDSKCADFLKVTYSDKKWKVHDWYNAEFGSASLNAKNTQVDTS